VTDPGPITIEDPTLSAYITFMPADDNVFIEASDPGGLVGPLDFTRADAVRLHRWLGQHLGLTEAAKCSDPLCPCRCHD
jgi:hypothetical protein